MSHRVLDWATVPASGRIAPADKRQGLFAPSQLALQLGILDRLQDLLETRAREETHLFQIFPGDEPGWPDLLGRSLGEKALHEFIRIEVAMARKTIQPVQLEMLLESREAHEP